jgi:hypothetical protein
MQNGQAVGSQVVGASVNYSPEFVAGEPNHNLLRRIAESGGGKILDPDQPLTENPFLHDRKKTHQPRDLWEWLLRMAVVLFVMDVGVRRVQIEREEVVKALAALRRWIFFWEGKKRAPEAEESLASLLAKRGEVRSTKTAAGEARAELFRPEQAVDLSSTPPKEPMPRTSQAPATEAKPVEEEKPSTTTSRLLEAKKRAQKRKG